MKLRIDIKMDNAAFMDNDLELQHLLDKVKASIGYNRIKGEGFIIDSNGNTVGKWGIK